MPVMSVIVAVGGLIHGAMLTIVCERVAPRHVEEVIEERGSVTVPVTRVVEEGRVDARITRKILGLLPISRIHLAGVTDVDSTSSTSTVTDSSGRRTSSYSTGRVDLTTRDGEGWSSEEISHSIGHTADEMEKRIDELLAANDHPPVRLWSMTWLSNIIGVGFTLVSLLFGYRGLASVWRRLAAR